MISQAAGLRRLDCIIWIIIAAVAAVVMATAALWDFHPVWRSFLAAGGTTALFLLGYGFYETRRPDPRLSGALGGTAQIVAFAAVGAPLSYLGASTNLPLYDAWFDAADRALGLNWSALLAWMDAHAAIHPLFHDVYFSLMPQTLAVILALAWTDRQATLRMFVLAFILASLATIALAAVFPAEGVWGFYNLHPGDYPHISPAAHGVLLPVFHGLRDGSYRLLVASGAEGIITFPSLHAALALILAAALWPLPVLRWPGIALNATMLVSIPVDGGHYFIDVFAGLAIAAVSLVAARAVIARFTAHPVPANAMRDPVRAREMAAPTG